MREMGLWKKIVCGATALAVIFVMTPALSVCAASEYTVTFRPGNVGRFGIPSGAEDGRTVQEMAEEVADVLYGAYEVSVTENGAIKVKVPAGAFLPAAPAYLIPDEGYCVRAWGPGQGEKAEKNVDFVADYGRLTDGVEYTVKYVDQESGESIAPFATIYANVGDSVSVSAPPVITTSDAGSYTLASAAVQEITLTENASENVLSFSYQYSYDPGTEIQEIITYLPGDTVTTTQTYTTVIDNGTSVEPGAVIAEDNGEEAAGDGGNAAGNMNNAEEPENNGEADENIADNGQNTEIEDEEVPLADSAEDAEELVTDIPDEQAPLGVMESPESRVNAAVILAGILGVLSVILGTVWIQRRKHAGTEETGESDSK